MAQSGDWTFAVDAGTVVATNQPVRLSRGFGGAVAASAMRPLGETLALSIDAHLKALPPGALTPRGVVQIASPPPVTGYFGTAGMGGSVLAPVPTVGGVSEYVTAGAGIDREYTMPHSSDGWRAGPLIWTGTFDVGYGARFGSGDRCGVELQLLRFAAGSVRWLVPLTFKVGI
ncbi:MAG TPA: hypothetical protein VF159_01205 [Gemmatimonadaceae bacterium]